MELKPVSPAVLAEARDEASEIMARLMGRLAPGQHVLRMWVGMDGMEKKLRAVLKVTVEGDGGADDLVEVEEKWFDNFVFLLTVGLAQKLAYGLMHLQSTAIGAQVPVCTVQSWSLVWGLFSENSGQETADVLGRYVEGASFLDAVSVYADGAEDAADEGSGQAEAVYPPVAYTVL
ncbi:hypothetical protein [Streptomyces adustus]